MYPNNGYNQYNNQQNGQYHNNQRSSNNPPQQQNTKYHHQAQSYQQNPNAYAQSTYQLPQNSNHHPQQSHNTHHTHHNTNVNQHSLQQPNTAAYFSQSHSTGNLMQYNNSPQQQYQQMQSMQHSMGNLNRSGSNPIGGGSAPPPPPSGPPPKNKQRRKKDKGKKKKSNNGHGHNGQPNGKLPLQSTGSLNMQQQQNGYNGYNNRQPQNAYNNMQSNGYPTGMNPQQMFQQQMQSQSQYGSFIGMQQPQMGSTRNFNTGGGYGLQQPSSDFQHQYGPTGPYAAQQMYHNTYFNNQTGQPMYYEQQPQGGGDVLMPPPPMEKDENGEMVLKDAKKDRKHSKKRKHKYDKNGKRIHRSKRDKDGKKRRKSRRDKHGKKKKKRSSSRTRDKKKKSGRDSPPPPPPPSGKNKLVPPSNGSEAPQGNTESEDSSSSSESEDFKDNVPDPGYKDASAVFQNEVDNAKKKKKGKHGRFESKNQFIRRRPVSGVPMSVQKQLHGVGDDKLSSHLKLIHSKRTEKAKETIKFLKECLLKEVLFQGMDDGMINEIVEVMYRVDCPVGECVIRQNEYGDAYFVIQTGAFDIIHQEMDNQQQKIVGEMLPGKAFGEGSLLYSIPRAATLKATKACVVWSLDATKFLEIRQKISQQVNDKTSKVVRYIKKLELFKKHHHQDLVAIGQAVTERKYPKNARIIQQGDEASEFFIVKTGAAIAVIKTDDGKEQTVKKYSDGDTFGERGIYKNDKRAASIIATSTTRCYVIKAADFKKLLANSLGKKFEEQIKEYDDIAFDNGIKRPFQNLIECKLEEFKTLGILGVGSFGRVSLVKDPKTTTTYSLKKVRKNKVIETGQQEHVRNERAVLATLDSTFCVKLFGTYQDELNIYFLMEPVLGGELFTVLRWNKRFSEKTARFYAACVVLAFEHLHGKNIIYRDLKPENLLISKNGYCKLVDFGFAKKRNNSCTLCGTPEYLSPEVIQNYSQGFAVDWWALGIFVHEMVVGHAPFQDDPSVKMYEKILTYDVEFPADPKLTPRVEHLICGLLEKNSFQRLGAGANGTKQILNHPWFHGLNWEEMRAQKIEPPYKPNIAGQDDLSHYDAYPDENIVEKLDPDPSAYEWCEDF